MIRCIKCRQSRMLMSERTSECSEIATGLVKRMLATTSRGREDEAREKEMERSTLFDQDTGPTVLVLVWLRSSTGYNHMCVLARPSDYSKSGGP